MNPPGGKEIGGVYRPGIKNANSKTSLKDSSKDNNGCIKSRSRLLGNKQTLSVLLHMLGSDADAGFCGALMTPMKSIVYKR